MTRSAPPNRRQQISLEFKRGDKVRFIASVGLTAEMKPIEVFLSCNKTTEIEALGRDASILISLALQYGCDFDTMRAAITRDEDGSASTLVGQILDEIEKIDPRSPFGADILTIGRSGP